MPPFSSIAEITTDLEDRDQDHNEPAFPLGDAAAISIRREGSVTWVEHLERRGWSKIVSKIGTPPGVPTAAAHAAWGPRRMALLHHAITPHSLPNASPLTHTTAALSRV